MSIQSITIDSLKATLHAIDYSQQLPESALYEYVLSKQHVPNTSPKQLQDYHVSLWLIQLISTNYKQLRQFHNLVPIDNSIVKADILQLICDDYLQNHKDLEAWSVMFIRYVNTYNNISTDEH